MKKVLVIGATGSTGLYITDHLSVHNYQVVATGLKKRNLDYYKKRGIEYITLDICRKEEFSKLPGDVDCVIHLAGLMPARMAGYDPYKYIHVNTLGTLNALEFCRINKIPKLIYAQSHSDVAGYWNTGDYIPADAPRKLYYKGDHAVYIISKCAALDLVEHYHQEYNLQTIAFRMPTIYCYWPVDTMYVDGEKRTMAYLVLIKKAMEGETLEIWGDPKIAKDIIYIKDYIQLVESAINSKVAQGMYNAGTGIPTTLEEQIRGIAEVFSPEGRKSKIIYKPEAPSQTSFFYDMSKAERDLNYQVKYPYMEMLKDMKKEMNNPAFELVTGA